MSVPDLDIAIFFKAKKCTGDNASWASFWRHAWSPWPLRIPSPWMSAAPITRWKRTTFTPRTQAQTWERRMAEMEYRGRGLSVVGRGARSRQRVRESAESMQRWFTRGLDWGDGLFDWNSALEWHPSQISTPPCEEERKPSSSPCLQPLTSRFPIPSPGQARAVPLLEPEGL